MFYINFGILLEQKFLRDSQAIEKEQQKLTSAESHFPTREEYVRH